MSSAPWTVGRYVVETLAANGVDTVFGIPGVHNIELYRGLEFARLRHVLVRHEQNAGFAADGYARVSGRSEEHTSELQSPMYLVCRLLLEKKKKTIIKNTRTAKKKSVIMKQTVNTQ